MHTHLQHDQQQQQPQQQTQRQRTFTGRLGMPAAVVRVGAVASAVAGFGAGAIPPVHAAPVRQTAPASAAPAPAGAVQVVGKTILPETSIAGPGLAGLEIAWTGTDAAHHLNVKCTTQFPQFPNPTTPKTAQPETALGAPAFTSTAGSDERRVGKESRS